MIGIGAVLFPSRRLKAVFLTWISSKKLKQRGAASLVRKLAE
jgi:hypothetical protein